MQPLREASSATYLSGISASRRSRKRRLAPAIAGVTTVLVATTVAVTLRPGDTISFEITRGSETATTSSYQLVWGDFRTLS